MSTAATGELFVAAGIREEAVLRTCSPRLRASLRDFLSGLRHGELENGVLPGEVIEFSPIRLAAAQGIARSTLTRRRQAAVRVGLMIEEGPGTPRRGWFAKVKARLPFTRQQAVPPRPADARKVPTVLEPSRPAPPPPPPVLAAAYTVQETPADVQAVLRRSEILPPDVAARIVRLSERPDPDERAPP